MRNVFSPLTACHPRPPNDSSQRLHGCAGRRVKAVLILSLLAMLASGEVADSDDLKREPVWQVDVGSRSDSCAAVADDGTIYFGTTRGQLFALDAGGRVKWKYQVGDEVRSSPAIGENGTIYFGSRDRFLYAVSPQGKRLWRYKTGGWVDSSPTIAADGKVIVGSWDKNLYCVSAEGVKRWEKTTGGPVTSSPAVGLDGTIYFGSHDGKLYALNPDGTEKWAYQTGGQIISSPAINGDDCVYFTSVDGFLYALDLDGSLKWKLKTGGITESSVVISHDGTLYLGVNTDLCSVTASGVERWRRPEDVPVIATPVLDANGLIYSINSGGMLVALGPQREWKWQYGFDGYGKSSLALTRQGLLLSPHLWKGFIALPAGAGLADSVWPKFRGNLRNTGRLEAR